jgi:uncharacterized protein (DUF305 family)
MKRMLLFACLSAAVMALTPGLLHAGDGAQAGVEKPQADDTPDMTCSDPEPQAFASANLKMMKGMGQAVTGDADRDFAMMMLPHHEGAVDMAKIELTYGRDPALKAMAKRIIEAQQPEIQQMKKWLEDHPSREPDVPAAHPMTPMPGH